MATNLEDKYQIKSEIDHVLSRAGMYMGSTNDVIKDIMLYHPSSNKIISTTNQVYNAGLQKLFDEILSNSVDEHRRNDSLFKVDKIEVSINKCGFITIKDNGGIPVVKHKTAGILIPQLIFGQLRTSSNYDDSKERNVVGTNGIGSKLTNIFSTKFVVETCDGKNKVTITWSDNMKNVEVSNITKTKEHYTSISFQIDLKRFELEELMLTTIRQMQKRCIDACATNPKLYITFESDVAEGKLNSSFEFTNFGDYVKLYVTDEQFESNINYNAQKFNITLLPISLGYNIGFVNGAICSKGTHIKVLHKQIVDKVLTYCKKNEMELITEKDILSRICLFVNASIKNPTYDSQTKETLTNKLNNYDLKLSDSFLNELLESKLIDSLKDYYNTKYVEEQRKETNKLNKLIKNTKNTKKLISATGTSENKQLWIFEGTSASQGFRKYRNPRTQSAYLLRGKLMNTFNLGRSEIIENQELREIIATLGLLFNEPVKNIKNLKFDKIVIDTDSDVDGHHICGLILAFLCKHFPELIKNKKVYRALSPIIICQHTKTKQKTYFYTIEDYHKEEKKFDKDYEIRYTKGLGGLDDQDYAIMLRQQKLIQFTIESIKDIESVGVWFEKSTEQRKIVLLESENENN